MTVPQPTKVLIRRLRRVARYLDVCAGTDDSNPDYSPALRARANTCWQAAARLAELAPFEPADLMTAMTGVDDSEDEAQDVS
jgi:hypothetical protein